MDYKQTLRTLLEQIAAEQGFKNYNLTISPISSGGANYSSVLYKAKLEETDSKTVLNLFIKVATLSDEIRDIVDVNVFDIEKYVYTKINKIFRELEDKYNVAEEDRLMLPKYYGARTVVREEMLVLEDLTAKGFISYDRHKSVDWAYASAAVRELAKFHALAMAFHKEYPEEHDKFCREYCYELITEETFNKMFKNGFNKTVEVVREENREKLKNFLDKIDAQMMREMMNSCKKAVLIHSDFRASNLMHRYKEDGSVQVVPVDYQTMRIGCVIVDLLYFIFNGTDEEFRKLHYQRLIDHYYTELSAAMTRLGVEFNYYSKDDFDYELREKLPYGLTVAAFTLPVVMIDLEDAPKVEDGLDMNTFSDLKTNEAYAKRYNGIVDDYVRWGVL